MIAAWKFTARVAQAVVMLALAGPASAQFDEDGQPASGAPAGLQSQRPRAAAQLQAETPQMAPMPPEVQPVDEPPSGNTAAAGIDPRRPGQTTLTPGRYLMTNMATGANINLTVTPSGQMIVEPEPAFQRPTNVVPPGSKYGAVQTMMQQPPSGFQTPYGGQAAPGYP